MECEHVETITEGWVLEHTGISQSDVCSSEQLVLTGSIRLKIVSLGTALVSFSSLKYLDISRNKVSCLGGLQYCQVLEQLNLYYNNISAMSELLRLGQNTALRDIDLRLNPVSTLSTEYRLMLVHALPNLTLLDNVPITAKDRMLSLTYHDTDQAYQFKQYNEGSRDIRLQQHVLSIPVPTTESTPCERFIRELRPPSAILHPSRDAYDAFSSHGCFTPSPKRKTSSSGSSAASLPPPPAAADYKVDTSRALCAENELLRAKCTEYKKRCSVMKSDRISKETYIQLQEDYFKSLKKSEELDTLYTTSTTELAALREHINTLANENTALKHVYSNIDMFLAAGGVEVLCYVAVSNSVLTDRLIYLQHEETVPFVKEPLGETPPLGCLRVGALSIFAELAKIELYRHRIWGLNLVPKLCALFSRRMGYLLKFSPDRADLSEKPPKDQTLLLLERILYFLSYLVVGNSDLATQLLELIGHELVLITTTVNNTVICDNMARLLDHCLLYSPEEYAIWRFLEHNPLEKLHAIRPKCSMLQGRDSFDRFMSHLDTYTIPTKEETVLRKYDKLYSCGHCGTSKTKLPVCRGCNDVYYCGANCQARHWLVHQITCAKRNAVQ